MKKIIYFNNMKDLSIELADKFYKLSLENINKKGFFSVALSGGNTPKQFYRTLAKRYRTKILWEKVYFFFSDERIVDKNSENSNFNLANSELFLKLNIPVENIYIIRSELKNIIEIAKNYEEAIIEFFKVRKMNTIFDVIFLGTGKDGHTASLFPNTDVLDETDKLISYVKENKNIKFNRITFCYPLINKAENVFFIVSKKGKEIAIKKIIENDNTIPALKVNSKNVCWFIDNNIV